MLEPKQIVVDQKVERETRGALQQTSFILNASG